MNKCGKKTTSELLKKVSVWYNITNDAFRDRRVLDTKLSVLLYVLFPKRTAMRKPSLDAGSTQTYFTVCCVRKH